MDIINDEQARELSKNFIPISMHETIMFVMKKIQNSASCGNRKVVFDKFNTDYVDYRIVLSNEFKKYIKHLGYNYEIHSEIKFCYCCEWVTISW